MGRRKAPPTEPGYGMTSVDRWLTTDPRDEEWCQYEEWCSVNELDPCGPDGEVDPDNWEAFQEALEPEYDPEPDYEPFRDDPSLDYLA